MADPALLDMADTHTKVIAVLRRNKVAEQIIADVSAQFPTQRPTMRAQTHTALKPKIRRVGALYGLWGDKIPYVEGYTYITVIGVDGVDKNQCMWIVACPKCDGDKARAEIREKVREYGLRAFSEHHTVGNLYLFPKKGVQISRAVAMKHPGLYLESRYPTSVLNESLNLVYVPHN